MRYASGITISANGRYQQLLQKYPDLISRVEGLPGRVFSGKEHPSPGAQGVFFCYAMPAPPPPAVAAVSAPPPSEQLPEGAGQAPWTEEAGETRWYLFDQGSGDITDDPTKIVKLIRSTPETPRKHDMPEQTLSKVRLKVEKHIKNTYLKQVQAPIGVKPRLKAWMELS